MPLEFQERDSCPRPVSSSRKKNKSFLLCVTEILQHILIENDTTKWSDENYKFPTPLGHYYRILLQSGLAE